MITDPVIAVETETVDDAIRKMIAHDLGELPVVDERGRLLGSISIHTILEAWLQTEGLGVGKDNASSSEFPSGNGPFLQSLCQSAEFLVRRTTVRLRAIP